MDRPHVDILIISFDNISDTRECLDSVLRTVYPDFTVHVVDNGSDNAGFRQLKQEFPDPRLRFTRNRDNPGFAVTNNRLLSRVGGPLAVLLNNDTTVDPKWLTHLVRRMMSDTILIACQPKIRSYYHRSYFDYAGGGGGYIDALGYPYVRGRVGFVLEKDTGQYDDPAGIQWASGSAMMVRIRDFARVGKLEETFFMYQEEIDWCWRALRLGYRIGFTPESVVYHKGAQAAKHNLDRRTYLVHRNNLLMVARNAPVTALIWIIPVRIVLDLAAAAYYLGKGHAGFVGSVVAAYAAFLRRLPGVIASRKSSGITERKIRFRPLSMYLAYFLLGRRRYSELVGLRQRNTSQLIAYTIY
ncbi:hypothetical protein A2Z33_04130 [Candidatus Gottesmanbacteria bacterium RBG_16_52_11]|uniref:Glycosyltransferase 2-like domain-containing protein n=1 Tax=Candidatus Gottesmanbacteria bacterium RBG_16_52_11 TaxID=1798374 RepID=A0A1F5YVT4_9BACT|nr:MAG: hypothetical protein A2Z33_04130 [Candidatus Gottesmanbacteria bacterium RBG_16_52_11]